MKSAYCLIVSSLEALNFQVFKFHIFKDPKSRISSYIDLKGTSVFVGDICADFD